MPEVAEVLARHAEKNGVRDKPGYGPGLHHAPLSVSTILDEVDEETGKKKRLAKTFKAYLPGDLNTAVEVLGEKEVFKYFINALVVDLQQKERLKLAPPEGAGRKKAAYMEQLGL